MIKGFRGTSLIDYPGKISSVVFTYKCNFRCPYCYNVDLVVPERYQNLKDLSQEFIIEELKRRKNFIKGVVITGGEPTVWGKILFDFIYKIKLETELLVKLDTNGSNPELIENLIKTQLIDDIAVDFKTSPLKYEKVRGNFELVKKSLEILKKHLAKVEIRITMYPPLVTIDDLKQMMPYLKDFQKIALQKFVPTETLNKCLGLQKEEIIPSYKYYQKIFDFLKNNLNGVEIIKRF